MNASRTDQGEGVQGVPRDPLGLFSSTRVSQRVLYSERRPTLEPRGRAASFSQTENNVRAAHKMQVGPCIPPGVEL
jgi:hypothetical protein